METCKEIVRMEWEFFQSVRNEGGRADCQDNRWEFALDRLAQLLTWNRELRESYRDDLLAARGAGRNPMEEKYGYMMEHTAPERYASIRAQLPTVPFQKKALAEQIVSRLVIQQERFVRQYPNLAQGARTITNTGGGGKTTSFETYLRGELYTYSERTLQLFRERVLALEREGRSMPEVHMENIAKMCGFASVDELEARSAPGERRSCQ